MLPPKTRLKEVVKAERVCQERAGPCGKEVLEEPPTYSHGGEFGSKEVEERERYRMSLDQGAEV